MTYIEVKEIDFILEITYRKVWVCLRVIFERLGVQMMPTRPAGLEYDISLSDGPCALGCVLLLSLGQIRR